MTGETAHARRDSDVMTSPIPRLELVVCEASSPTASTRLAERLEEAITLRPRHLILDVTACDSLGAAAIAVMVDAHRSVRRYGGQLWLRGAGGRIRRLLNLSGVEHVFDLLPPADPRRTP